MMIIEKIYAFRALMSALVRWTERRLGRRAFLVAGGVWALLAVLDLAGGGVIDGIENRTFDFALKHRISPRLPDPGVLIVDIDERSLAEMTRITQGGWPWSRAVHATVIEHLRKQGARAIVSDIVFSEPSAYSPEGDAYLNEVLAASDNVYLPWIRLSSANDGESKLHASRIPGAILPDPKAAAAPAAKAPADPTIAAALPVFPAARTSPRSGYNNLAPDADGLLRSFALSETVEGGIELPSIAYRLALDLGFPKPAEAAPLIHWNRAPGSYPRVSFVEAYHDAENGGAQANPYKGKIVILSSTAAGVASLSSTPISPTHPGADILATVVDNLKNHDFIRRAPPWLTYVLTLAAIAFVSLMYARERRIEDFELILAGLNVLGLSVFYGALNFAAWYVDLVSPLSYVNILYLGFAGYELWKNRYLANRRYYDQPLEDGEPCVLHAMLIQFCTFEKHQIEEMVRTLQAAVLDMAHRPSVLAGWFDRTSLFGRELSDIVVVYWLAPPGTASEAAIAAEAFETLRQVRAHIDEELFRDQVAFGGWRHSPLARLAFKFDDSSRMSSFHESFADALGRLLKAEILGARQPLPTASTAPNGGTAA